MAVWFIIMGTMALIAWKNHHLNLGGISLCESPDFRLTEKQIIYGLGSRWKEGGWEKGWVNNQEEFLRQGTQLLRRPEVLWVDGESWKREKNEGVVDQEGDGVGTEDILSLLEADEDPICFCVLDAPGMLAGPLSLSSRGESP